MVTRPPESTMHPRARHRAPTRSLASARTSTSAALVLALVVAALGIAAIGSVSGTAGSASAAPLPAGTFCEGPQPSQPVSGPTKVVMVELENESSSSISGSPDAPFENGTLSAQCGNFATSAMHSTTHPSESNYFAEVSGLNAAINSGADAQARFGLSDCPPDSTLSVCTYGGGHFPASVPSLFSQLEAKYGTSGWKTYADDMLTPCEKNDDNIYARTANATYRKYVTKHNPAVFFDGIACATQDVPSGDWKNGQGALYNDIVNGTLPPFTYLQPNDIDNGHDPVAVNGVTVAGGKSQIANIDNYLSSIMSLLQRSPDYQSGNLVVMITFDEGTKAGPIAGEDTVGENCADPNISPLATSCQVQTWLVGRYIPSYLYTGYMNQFGLLAATQRILGVSPLLGHAADASTPDIVNGSAALPDPFNLQANGTPPAPTVPGAPTGLTATSGSSSVGLAWSAPASTGGQAITDYLIEQRTTGSTVWSPVSRAPSTATFATVSGLVNGTSYDFRVSAVNPVGTGAPSATVTSAPGATGPELLPDPGFESGLGGWTPFSVGTMTRVTAPGSPVRSGVDSLSVAATSSTASKVGMGQNTAAAKSIAGTVYTAQCWVQPVSNPNLTIQIHFVEYKSDYSSYVLLQTTSIPKLSTGVWTLVKVSSTAVNSNERMIPQIYSTNETTATGAILYDDCSLTTGTGAPVVTPPGPPTSVVASAGAASASVAFAAPASNGGAPITGYRVTASPGGATATGSASPLVVSGLTNGTAYTFTVTATNSAGTSSPSAASAAVTPADSPAAPAAPSATPGDGSVALSWSAPASNGSPITGYVVQYSLSGAANWVPVSGPGGTATAVNVPGLTNGQSYDFHVAAVNAIGESDFSDITAATPVAPVITAPDAPTIGAATAGDASASVTFSAPANTGGHPILDYTVTSSGDAGSPSGHSVSGSGSPIVVPGLTNGTAYTFTVTARSDAGSSVPSAASNSVTPAAAPTTTVPGAPTAVSATPGNRTAVVSFSAPASNGGAAITGYTVTSSPGGLSASGTTSPLTVSGLTNGTAYTFTVTATNSVGTGAASGASAAVTPYLELLPDAGFESGLGGWVPFSVGTMTRVTAPASSVRSGADSLNIAATGAAASKVGMTQNTVVSKSVAGATYTAQCWVQPTSPNLTIQIHWVEYKTDFSSYILLQTTSIPKLTVGTWTLIKVSSVAVNSNERMIPQIYSINQTTATGSILYDDCSVTSP